MSCVLFAEVHAPGGSSFMATFLMGVNMLEEPLSDLNYNSFLPFSVLFAQTGHAWSVLCIKSWHRNT